MEDYKKVKGLKNLQEFQNITEKITMWENEDDENYFSSEESVFLLSCALILLKNYDVDKRYKSYAEFAYYLILKYSLITKDFNPLYDFSTNFGFYPISRSLIKDNKIQLDNIMNYSINDRIETEYSHDGLIETYEQKESREIILDSESDELCLIAPTSYGKSGLIIEDIKKNLANRNAVAIIVPTKSLLTQTYRALKKENFYQKIIIHDEMYENEKRFISVLTQERALRLLNKNENLYFDVLYIDEAHNLFNKDSRNILLSRLIKLNKIRNKYQKVIYLSPLISDSDNLRFNIEQDIVEQHIEFNMKEAELYELRLDLKSFKYNRFIDSFFEKENYKGYFNYIEKNSIKKNFIYLYSPRKIEMFAKDLFNHFAYETIVLNSQLEEVINNLKKYVHNDFYEIEYLKKGIAYIHGKLPDNIKEYLEYKFQKIPEIKYLIANKVILEGVNLPIDNLFVLSTHNISNKDLTNLIGRVNRLNMIFQNSQSNYELLLPKVHFINNREYNRSNSNMSNKIRGLRTGNFEDVLDNPLLLEFDIDKFDNTKESDVKKIEEALKIQEEEKFVLSESFNDIGKLKKKMLDLGMNTIYLGKELLYELLVGRIQKNILENQVNQNNIVEKIRDIFINGLEDFIVDEEFRRLGNDKAVNYYENFLKISKSKSLKENIGSIIHYFKEKRNSDNSKLYIGKSFGEIAYEGRRGFGNPVYIDLYEKDDKVLANIAIIKFKLESDFVSYKLMKFIQFLLDYDIIDNQCYNEIIYGTNDKRKLSLLKLGLTINIINKLESDNQIINLQVDENNIIFGNQAFLEYKNTVDDFFKFEIEKFIN